MSLPIADYTLRQPPGGGGPKPTVRARIPHDPVTRVSWGRGGRACVCICVCMCVYVCMCVCVCVCPYLRDCFTSVCCSKLCAASLYLSCKVEVDGDQCHERATRSNQMMRQRCHVEEFSALANAQQSTIFPVRRQGHLLSIRIAQSRSAVPQNQPSALASVATCDGFCDLMATLWVVAGPRNMSRTINVIRLISSIAKITCRNSWKVCS